MQTPPFLELDGWSALIKSNPGTCKLLSSHEISELRKVSARHKISTLLLEILPCKSAYFWKLCGGILFRFQWQIERLWSCFCLRPGLSSISPLILIISPCNQIWWINNITATLWTALLDKIWIFLTLAFTFFIARQKNNKLKKIEFVSNKSSKLRKSSFGNNLSEKRLDEFAQIPFYS